MKVNDVPLCYVLSEKLSLNPGVQNKGLVTGGFDIYNSHWRKLSKKKVENINIQVLHTLVLAVIHSSCSHPPLPRNLERCSTLTKS
jgi:hypothetical protein